MFSQVMQNPKFLVLLQPPLPSQPVETQKQRPELVKAQAQVAETPVFQAVPFQPATFQQSIVGSNGQGSNLQAMQQVFPPPAVHPGLRCDLIVGIGVYQQIITTITVDEFASGFKSIINFTIPDPNSGKLEVQYQHENAGLSCSSGLTPVPLVEVNGVFGNGRCAVGGEAAFDTNSGTFTKYNAGIGINESDFTVALLLMDKGDTWKASYVHNATQDKKTTVCAEIVHKLSKNENTFTFGHSFAWNPMTIVKTRLNNHGTAAGLVQHEWRPKSTVTLSVTKPWEQPLRYGLGLALKP
ncbi:hypothetical protein L7F22_041750 [Adiantum nelumboides]|nr:hypothetical protein [Adiantum nelumboides]